MLSRVGERAGRGFVFTTLREFGTHRGDTFDDADHSSASNIDASTYARVITASFVLADNVLTVTV